MRLLAVNRSGAQPPQRRWGRGSLDVRPRCSPTRWPRAVQAEDEPHALSREPDTEKFTRTTVGEW